MVDSRDLDALEAERDLYRELIDLTACDEPAVFFAHMTALLQRYSQASTVFIGVFAGETLLHSGHRGTDGPSVQTLLDQLSTGVLRRSIETGRTVQTSSALLDSRFRARESVRRNQIEAVLCVPFAIDLARTVVVYLQRRAGQGPFPRPMVQRVEALTSRIGTIGRAALATDDDPTRAARDRLIACRILGRSPAIAHLLDQVATVAPLAIDVLITGPTGAGKSMLASTLHANSARHAGPLITVNCPAVADSLFEAEFFGAAAGAYTGATADREGFVQAADGGTLFLDEVADLSLGAQAKLLQLLQERTYTRVGDPRPRRADLRVVAATHTDLDDAVAQGRFRADLRYRLEVVPMRMPSLAERRGDIPELVVHVFQDVLRRHPMLSGLALSPATIRAAQHAEWPGNVRQLAHAVEAGAIRAHARRCAAVEPQDLLPDVSGQGPRTWQSATRAFQRELLQSTLAATGGNVTEAARALDIARSHAYELIKALEVER
jgi:Nif-specific regulatory protein